VLKKNKKIILKKHKLAISFFEQLSGLMFKERKDVDYALIFILNEPSTFSATIHTFFMNFPIHLIFLDSSKKIVDIKKNLKPYNLYKPKHKSKYIIEIPSDINIDYLKKGDKLSWSENVSKRR